ncbi:MAG: hypothetical protein MI739_01955 [Bacteroidales bacterium]|nr:hypothetical protein [Bacteroidales bacterium]
MSVFLINNLATGSNNTAKLTSSAVQLHINYGFRKAKNSIRHKTPQYLQVSTNTQDLQI